MKLFWTLLLCIGFCTQAFSQVAEECIVLNKTINNERPFNSEIKLSTKIADFKPITFNIFFWGFRLEDNTGNTAFNIENIENAVEWLNSLYNQNNIFFNLSGYDIILSNEYYKLENAGQFSSMVINMRNMGFAKDDAFNVYVSNEYSGFAGIIEEYHNTFIGISSAQLLNSGTLEHEVGHCFNLLHTNEDTIGSRCESAIRDPNNLYYNADIAGDFVIDTAAGYKFGATDIDPDTCTMIAVKEDCYGFWYKIPSSLLHNFMTISTPCEKTHLTDGQFIRIRKAIERDPYGSFERATVE